MKTKMFTLLDTKAEAFGVPFFMPQTAMAKRAVMDLSRDPQSMLSKHREDFVLYEIGEFDDSIGSVIPYATPKNLGIAPSEITPVDSVIANREPVETLDLSFIKNGETSKVK